MPNLSKAKQKKARDWLKQRGHNKSDVDSAAMDTDEEFVATIYRLHGVEYQAQGGA